MKKLIGILGVAVIAMAMFLNTNNMNSSNGDLDLANLLTMNTANAEDWGGIGSNKCVCKPNQGNKCLPSNFITARLICKTGVSSDSECSQNDSYCTGNY